MLKEILEKDVWCKEDIARLLAADEDESLIIFEKSAAVKKAHVGNKVYFRGLIEYSNQCVKNCFYCGIRSGNGKFSRYELTDEEALQAARFAWENRYASIVIQSGERADEAFVEKIEKLIRKIQEMTGNELHITLSLGEQSEDTYRRWLRAGSHRYLLRVEASNPEIYKKLHPDDGLHTYAARVEALGALRRAGYQVGTGVMIGLPFQTPDDLADDLIFFRDFDIDMVGMGPYIEHPDTPLYQFRDKIPSPAERLRLSLKMVALLRIMMKNINIAATTAMQTLDPSGREKALSVGANVLMPNLTPAKHRSDYLLYENKPLVHEDAGTNGADLESRILSIGDTVAYGEWGDSRRYMERP
jgi:biotin synthase